MVGRRYLLSGFLLVHGTCFMAKRRIDSAVLGLPGSSKNGAQVNPKNYCIFTVKICWSWRDRCLDVGRRLLVAVVAVVGVVVAVGGGGGGGGGGGLFCLLAYLLSLVWCGGAYGLKICIGVDSPSRIHKPKHQKNIYIYVYCNATWPHLALLLMEEILHQLGCIKTPATNGIFTVPYQLV